MDCEQSEKGMTECTEYGLTVPGIKMLMATKECYDTERDVLEDQRRYDKNILFRELRLYHETH